MAVEAEVVEDVDEESTEGRDGEEDDDDTEVGDFEEFLYSEGFRGRGEEADYDRDPEFAEIIKSCLDDPQKAQARVQERIRKKKKNKILQAKTGSAKPLKVTFNKMRYACFGLHH